MRIAVVASNTTILPPPKDGGTERIVHELTEGLARKGHEVFLYARGGSRSSGTVISYPFDNFGDAEIATYVSHTLPPNVDVIHDHTFRSSVSSLSLDIPVVSTRHIPSKTGASNSVYVSQDALKSIGNGEGIYIHNALPPEEYQFQAEKQNYLLFMGRIVSEKGVTHAIDVAEWTNNRLVIAGPKHDTGYFNKRIAPRLKRNPKLSYVGPVGGQDRQNLLKNAKCLLFPTQWREPFGLVMIEAMACGTPVLALDKGAVKEVLSGFPEFICSTPQVMAKRLKSVVGKYPASTLRNYVISNFHHDSMVDRYIQHYHEAIQQRTRRQ